MSVTNEGSKIACLASADLSSDKRYRFVYEDGVTSSSKYGKVPTVAMAGDAQNVAEATVHILQNEPKQNEVAKCMALTPGKRSYLRVDGAYAKDALLMIKSDGRGTALAGTTKYGRAKVVEASTAENDIIEVEILNPTKAGA